MRAMRRSSSGHAGGDSPCSQANTAFKMVMVTVKVESKVDNYVEPYLLVSYHFLRGKTSCFVAEGRSEHATMHSQE